MLDYKVFIFQGITQAVTQLTLALMFDLLPKFQTNPPKDYAAV